ncbi:MAG: hypothetical protein IKB16_00615 [Lentisphaeria bacterium]|nr:hypothetical protein [Lentisphaeria bacterium]
MKITTITAVLFASIVICGAENLMKQKTTTYKVSPGSWYKGILKSKQLGKLIDRDLDMTSGKRKGMLSDGKTFQQAVAYNYHNIPKEKRFLTVDIDLGKAVDLDTINVIVMENNNMHKPSHVEVSFSQDNMVFRNPATCKEWIKKQYDRKAVLKGDWKQSRFVRIKIYAASTWLNLTEVEIFAK